MTPDRSKMFLAILALAAACTPPAEETAPNQPLVAAPFDIARPEALGLDEGKLSDLAAMTREWSEQDRIVGAEILIVKDRQIALRQAVGWSDREARVRMTPGSIFRLRSMTKPFTGTAALILVDQGHLDLRAPVGRYLPSWHNARSQDITVEQLLTHYSGFDQGGTPEPASTYPTLRAVVDASGEQGPQGRPGERFAYSDVNTMTLGALVTELTGVPLDTFIRERIVQPLDLNDVYVGFSVDVAWAGRTNPTYDRDEFEEWRRYWTPAEDPLFSWFRASGGMFSTTVGYAEWLAKWLDPSTESGLARDGPSGLVRHPLAAIATQVHGFDDIAGYGYHWEVWREEPLVFGHTGSDGTLAVAVPSEQLLLLYFTQSRRNGTRAEWLDAALAATLPDA